VAEAEWNAKFVSSVVEVVVVEDVEVRERVRRSMVMGFEGLSVCVGRPTSSSSSLSERYCESGTIIRGSSKSSETECSMSAMDIGFLARVSEAAVRRMLGGGRFSFSCESVDLRFKRLMEGVVMAAVWESGMEMSSFSVGLSSDCD